MSQSNEKKQPFAPPRTPAEELITEIYGSLLGIEDVSVFDSFCDLGGGADHATNLAVRLSEVFRVEVAPSEVIAAPTVDRLVTTLARKWGGREIVDEIAWTFMQVDQLSDLEADSMLRSEADYELAIEHGAGRSEWSGIEASIKRRRLVELLLEKTGITLEMRESLAGGESELPDS